MLSTTILVIIVLAIVAWISGFTCAALLFNRRLEELRVLKAKTRYLPDFEVDGKAMNLLTISGGNVWYEVYSGPHGHDLRRVDYETNDKITHLLATQDE